MRPALLLSLVLALAACSGPAGPEGPVNPDPDPPPAYPVYETFDPAGYDAEPRPQAQPVEHDVPDRLMEGRVEVPDAGRGTVRTVQGFRVQVFSSEDRASAERIQADAALWWAEVRGSAGAPDDLTPQVVYIQPYYRVRLGGFEFREDAEEAAAFARRRFPEAFIASDLVTIRD